jgi:sec-independent protein translocase protein TatA
MSALLVGADVGRPTAAGSWRGGSPHRPGSPTSSMGFDSPEKLAIVFLIALIVFGPSRLPELGRSLGEGIRGFKDSVDGRDEPGDHPPRQP